MTVIKNNTALAFTGLKLQTSTVLNAYMAKPVQHWSQVKPNNLTSKPVLKHPSQDPAVKQVAITAGW